jgi:hypothetical protein
MPILPALGKLKQENLEFKLVFIYIVRLCLKKKMGGGYETFLREVSTTTYVCNPSDSGNGD